MRELNDIELFQCRYVSDLFAYSSDKKECSSKIFIKAYVYSSISLRISSRTFFFESLNIEAAYEAIKKEKNITIGNDVYPSYVMAWIGYILKYFECATSIPLIAIYKKIKPEELYRLYEAYHSLDNAIVVKRIAEAKKINLDLNNAELMKRIN